MDQPLKGRTALITGSGRGLGYAMATRLAELGANVALHDRSQDAPAEFGESASLDDAADKLRRFGGSVLALVGDIADQDATERMAREVEAALGPVEILVNCAGGDIAAAGGKPNPNDALHIKMEDVRALIDRNLIGTMLMCRAIVPGMAERRRGSVINVASAAAHVGVSPEVAYSTIKAAIVHYTRCLAAEMRPKGVRVNVVSPGATMSGRFLATRKTDPQLMEAGASLERYGKPEEVADVVAFLASDASRFMSGQVLRVDGGKSLFPA